VLHDTGFGAASAAKARLDAQFYGGAEARPSGSAIEEIVSSDRSLLANHNSLCITHSSRITSHASMYATARRAHLERCAARRGSVRVGDLRQGLSELYGLGCGNCCWKLEQAGAGEIGDHGGDAGVCLGPVYGAAGGGCHYVRVNYAQHGAGGEQNAARN